MGHKPSWLVYYVDKFGAERGLAAYPAENEESAIACHAARVGCMLPESIRDGIMSDVRACAAIKARPFK